jgi:(S)-mandelate dehydrogenase
MPSADASRIADLYARFPTIEALREHARRHAPRFAFEYADGGAGNDAGIVRNRLAFDSLEMFPRYGACDSTSTIVDLFGRRYTAPIGISPMGTPSLAMPGADIMLARAAQSARIPYVLSAIGGATIEEVASQAGDVFWFQMVQSGSDDRAVESDLLHRAEHAGAHVLVLTLDVPVYTPRPRASQVGLGGSTFRPSARMIWGIATSPLWLSSLMRHGVPRFASLRKYMAPGASLDDTIAFAQRELGGPFRWTDLARFRERWKRPLVVKGILSPEDAEKAIALGVDGIVVSNHGGRQVDALPASIDCLADVVKVAGGRTTVMLDSGVRSGSDVVRALALGASAAFAGKAFLWSLCALGAEGPSHAIRLFQSETQAVMSQLGIGSIDDCKRIAVRRTGGLGA